MKNSYEIPQILYFQKNLIFNSCEHFFEMHKNTDSLIYLVLRKRKEKKIRRSKFVYYFNSDIHKQKIKFKDIIKYTLRDYFLPSYISYIYLLHVSLNILV